MVKRTLAQVRPALSQVAGMTGMSLVDARFIARLNEVQQELMNENDFPGVCDNWAMNFDETTGLLVLPYWLDRLLQVTVDGVPAQIMSPWAELINYGVGPQSDEDLFDNGTGNLVPRCWISICLDRGEVVSRFPIPPTGGPWVIRCYAQVPEAAGAKFNLQGFLNDRVVRTQPDGTGGDWINGAELEIDFAQPFTVTTQQFDRLTDILKPSTNGYCRIAAWNGTTEVTLSDYAPSETEISYRSYYIPQLFRSVQGVRDRVIIARARRRFVPVVEDDDPLVISNVNALKCGIIALWKRDAGDYAAFQFQKAQAVDILRKEATAYLGKARTPGISFTRGFPLGAMPYLR